ncbi:hypothetical protein TrRE_jg4559, partial [Triparma retinervis]
MKKWGGSYVQIAGPPWSIFVRPLDAEKDIAPDGSVIRPVAVKERGRDGISLCCTRKVYSNSGILKGGNVLVDFKGKPKSGRYFGKEKGDEILGIFGIDDVVDGFLHHLDDLASEPGLWRVELVVEGDLKVADLRELTLSFARPGGNILGLVLSALGYRLHALTFLESIDSLILPCMRMENLFGKRGMDGWGEGGYAIKEAYVVSGVTAAIMGLCTEETDGCVRMYYENYVGENAHIPWLEIAIETAYSREEFKRLVVDYYKGRAGGQMGEGYFVK